MKTIKDFIDEYFIYKSTDHIRNEYTIEGYEVEESMIMLERKEIIEKALSDTLNKYGNRIQSEEAGDYSISNWAQSALDDCVEEVCNHFNQQLEKPQKDELFEIIKNSDFSNIGSYPNIMRIFNSKSLKSFVEKWIDENEIKTLCKCYEFWDGSNYRSVIFWDEVYGDNCDIEEVEYELYEKIYNEMFKGGKEVLEYEDFDWSIKRSDSKSFIFLWQGRLSTYGIKIFEKE